MSKQMPPMTTRENPSKSSRAARERSPSIVQTGPTSSAKDAASSRIAVTDVPRLPQRSRQSGPDSWADVFATTTGCPNVEDVPKQEGCTRKHTHYSTQGVGPILMLTMPFAVLLVFILVFIIVVRRGVIRVCFVMVGVVVTMVVRPHLDTAGSEDPHNTQTQECRDCLRAMPSPTQDQRPHTECNRDEGKQPFNRLAQEKPNTQCSEDERQKCADRTVYRAQCAGHRPQPVGYFI